jgi:WD40 repeat protein
MPKRRKLNQYHLTRQQRETVLRSPLLSHPLVGRLTLRSQLGEALRGHNHLDPSEGVAAYYASSLSQGPIYRSRVNVGGFVVDESTGAIIFAHVHDGDRNDTLHCIRPTRPGHYGRTPHIFEAMPNSFVDMSISNQFGKLFCASSGPRGTRAVLLEVPQDGDDPHSSVVNHAWTFRDETAWQIAVSPTTGGSFALASSFAIRLVRMLPEHISCIVWTSSGESTRGEHTAVAFGQDDRIVMGGQRSGIVKFFDERTRDSVQRLRHGSGVSAIRMIDRNRVVVRGLETMSLYDLRYTAAPSNMQIESKIHTSPYRTFPWETASVSYQLGFDYHPELGVIATSSSISRSLMFAWSLSKY